MAINISNSKNRDAVVTLDAVRPHTAVRYQTEDGRPVTTRRTMKSDIEHDIAAIQGEREDVSSVSALLVDGDPEIDIERFGLLLSDTSRIYVSENGIAHLVEEFEVIKNPDGTVRERRPRKKQPQNIDTDVPLKWTGKFIKKDEAARRFVLSNKRQLAHINGLTYDFLFEMAKELDKRKSFMLLRAGDNADEPVVLTRGGRSYNAFLEGRVKGTSYCLLLHLSNMELKKPAEVADDTD
jgi:hypothetical protein